MSDAHGSIKADHCDSGPAGPGRAPPPDAQGGIQFLSYSTGGFYVPNRDSVGKDLVPLPRDEEDAFEIGTPEERSAHRQRE